MSVGEIADDVEWLYHVTTYGRLESIAEDGLRKGLARAIGAPSYDSHAARGIFLTEVDGVFFWMSKAEDHAESGSDKPYEDGLLPVVLRTAVDWLEFEDLIDDNIGTNDALANAWIYPGNIEPGSIELWNGEEWVTIDEWETVDPEEGFGEEESEEDDPDMTWRHFVDLMQSPFLPPEAKP